MEHADSLDEVAEQTQQFALAEAIDRELVAKWLEGQTNDLDDYETFFRATESSGDLGSRHPMLEDWLAPLESYVHNEHRVRELHAQAEREGVKIYDLKYDRAAEAASSLHHRGFVALAALSPALLRRQRRLSAALLRRAARAQPGGNRGARRYSLGRSTMVPGTLELAQNPQVLEVLKAF